MKKTLLFAAFAALTTSAFADSAMDLTIPDSTPGAVASSTGAMSGGVPPVAAAPAGAKPALMAQVRPTAQPATVATERVQPVRAMAANTASEVLPHSTPQPSTPRTTARAVTPTVPAAASATVAPSLGKSAAADPIAAAQGAADSAASDAQVTPGVNPFTGKSLSEEELQRQLEASKAKTALLEEQLKQVTLTADIANVPIKKRAEVAKLELPAPPVAAPAPVVQKPVAKPRKVAKKEPAVEVVAQKAPNVKLAGIVVNSGVASAILDIDGNSSIVANGSSSPFGPVKVLTATSAMVGGMALHVSEDSTIARVHISDPKPVDPKDQKTVLPTLPMNGVGSSSGAHPLPPVPLPPATTATVAGNPAGGILR